MLVYLPHLFVFSIMADDDLGIPIQHIPAKILQQLALHLDVGTEHTWENLAEYMEVDAVTILVGYFAICVFNRLILGRFSRRDL